MSRRVAVISFFFIALASSSAAGHTGVPAEPSGLHPIFHGETLVGGYTSKGFVSFASSDEAPVWRRMPATSGMYVAAYGTPDGRSFALTTAGLWEFTDGGCTYTESQTQFGPMTLVQSAFHPTGNYLSWIGATASNGKPILYFSNNGSTWTRVLTLPPGLGWRGMLWDASQESGIAVFREREALRLVSLLADGSILSLEALPDTLPLEAVLLEASADYSRLYFRSVGDSDVGERLWACDLSDQSCDIIFDSPDKLFHALWHQDESTLAWMDETGDRRLIGLDGALLNELTSVGYFGFLPNLGSVGWFLKKLPAAHAFSILGDDGVETPWMNFEDILIDPCPPKPGEEVDDSNPFEEIPVDETEDGTDPTEEEGTGEGNAAEADQDKTSSGCHGTVTTPWLLALMLCRRRR